MNLSALRRPRLDTRRKRLAAASVTALALATGALTATGLPLPSHGHQANAAHRSSRMHDTSATVSQAAGASSSITVPAGTTIISPSGTTGSLGTTDGSPQKAVCRQTGTGGGTLDVGIQLPSGGIGLVPITATTGSLDGLPDCSTLTEPGQGTDPQCVADESLGTAYSAFVREMIIRNSTRWSLDLIAAHSPLKVTPGADSQEVKDALAEIDKNKRDVYTTVYDSGTSFVSALKDLAENGNVINADCSASGRELGDEDDGAKWAEIALSAFADIVADTAREKLGQGY